MPEKNQAYSLQQRIDSVCDAFEKQWMTGMSPDIHQYLPKLPAAQREEILVELIILDLSYRWHSEFAASDNTADGDSDTLPARPTLEDYSREFPELISFDKLPLELIVEEYRVRHLWGDQPSAEIFLKRFLNRQDLETALIGIERKSPLPHDAEMPGSHLAQSDSEATKSSASRYEVLRHHASGGLGKVSIALDTELNREVALKEIQEQFADDSANQSRFVAEAEITGRLEHPGIVPVYGFGRDRDGRPYYAMRFIRGITLKAAIDEYHSSVGKPENSHDALEFQRLLRRFVDVCNAIEYAHSRGVLHRDIKPENVMLGDYGETLVVDWGLAKSQIGNSEKQDESSSAIRPREDWSRTLSGSVVGTPAYMSPEQAAGKVDELTVASDVYSLGTTLYQILTGLAPYEGKDPEAVIEAVQIGAFQKPRYVRQDVPKPLEAVCTKAMQTEPEARYESAKVLAEDVERYLADEPVQAHRESIFFRSARWSRKHRTLVSSAVVLLITVSIAQGVSTVTINNAHNKTKLAYDEMKLAQGKTQDALDETRKTIDNYVKTVKTEQLLKREEFKPLLKKMLKDARAYYTSFIENHEHDDEAIQDLAKALIQVGQINYRSGDIQEAIEAFEKAIELQERLVSENRSVINFQRDLAVFHLELGIALRRVGAISEAIIETQKSRDMFALLSRHHPTNKSFEEKKAQSHNNLVVFLADMGKYPEALSECQKAEAIFKRLAQDHPKNADYQFDLATFHNNKATILGQTEKLLEAIQEVQKSKKIYEKLVVEKPNVRMYRNELAKANLNIGILFHARKNPVKAMRSITTARDIFAKLVSGQPTVIEYRVHLAATQSNIGQIFQEENKLHEALASLHASQAILEELIQENANASSFHATYANTISNIGFVNKQEGNLKKAAAHFRKALEIREKLFQSSKSFERYRIDLIASQNALAWLLATATDESVRNGNKAVDLARKACELGEWKNVYSLATLAVAYAEIGDFEKAIEWNNKAQEIAKAQPNTSANQNMELLEHQKLFKSGKPIRENFSQSSTS